MSATGVLQFDRAEYADPDAARAACAACRQTVDGVYYEAGGRLLCERCRRALESSGSPGGEAGRLWQAALLGVTAGALGVALWHGVRVLTEAEWGIVALVVGALVGGAVRWGSEGRGGTAYQLVAVLLTYLAIASADVPAIHAADRRLGLARSHVDALWLALQLPFKEGKGVIGLLLIAFALYEAWKINRPRRLVVSGPYRFGGRPSAATDGDGG